MGQTAMRVLVTDFMGEPDLEREVLPGVEVESLLILLGHAPTPADLLRVVEERPAGALIAWHEIFFSASTLAALGQAGVRGIVRAGVGYDNVNLEAARAAGMTICNVPDYGTDEVADHAMSLLLWCLRCLGGAPPGAAWPESWWDAGRFTAIRRLQGRALALLGFGRIGQAVARRAQAFVVDVRLYDPYVPRGQDKVTRTVRVENLHDLLVDADALSIHCLLSEETRHLIDAQALALLPPHAVLVNTARGSVVDESALLAALRSGHLAAVALDVLSPEPPIGNALYDAYGRGALPSVLLPPPVAWYSPQRAAEL